MKKRSLILCSMSVILIFLICVSVWWIRIKLKDDRSFLFQLRELAFPTSYSRGQLHNLKRDLGKAENDWTHTVQGRTYYEAGNYESAVIEYKMAIEIIEKSPGDQYPINISRKDAENMDQWRRVFAQKFPRHRLVEVYEKVGKYREAIEQIDWLLAHNPLDHIKLELLSKREALMKRIDEISQKN